MSDEPKTRNSRFETIFLRYGAGSQLFHPLTRNKFWNLICWTLIVLGVIGWVLGLWFIRANFGNSDFPDLGPAVSLNPGVLQNQEMRPFSRRRLLASSIAGLSLARAETTRKLKIVVTGGHPGDPEYGCGGTIARYADAGHQVVLLYLNQGEKHCPAQPGDPGSTVRVAEARKACQILNCRPAFAGQCDGNAIVDSQHYANFRSLLAAENPDLLFTHWPIDAHPDHRAISSLAYDAWLRLGKKFGFYYYEVSNGEDTLMFSPTEFVDISQTEARKREACYAHASQAPDRFYALQSQVTRFRGLESGHSRAEGFIRHSQSPGNLLL